MNKLWVDDMRPAPDETWDLAQTSAQALTMIKEIHYDEVSLDHDLGMIDQPLEAHDLDPDEDKPYGGGYVDTTRPIVLYWCENGGWPNKISVHSSNPVGIEWLTGMIERYKE